MSDDPFTADQVIDAIESFLGVCEKRADPYNGSYFAGSGWAASCLRWHLGELVSAQGELEVEARTTADNN